MTQAITILLAIIGACFLQLQHRQLRAQEARLVAALEARYDLPTIRAGQRDPLKVELRRAWQWMLGGTQLGLLTVAVAAALLWPALPGPMIALVLLPLAGGQVGRAWGARLRGPAGEARPLGDVVPPTLAALTAVGAGLGLVGLVAGILVAHGVRELGVVVWVALLLGGSALLVTRARAATLAGSVAGINAGLVEAMRCEGVRAQSVALAMLGAVGAVLLPLLGLGAQHPSLLPWWALATMAAGALTLVGAFLAGLGVVPWYLDHAGRQHRRDD